MGKRFKAIIPKGTHLASSKDTYGAKRGTLLSDYNNQVVGQAEFVEEDDSGSSDSSMGSLLMIGAAILGGFALSKAIESRSIEKQKRMQQELLREERREKRNAAIRKYLILSLMYCCKFIWIAIAWCAKLAFLVMKKFSIWSYTKIKKHFADKKSRKMEANAMYAKFTPETYTEIKAESSTSLVMAPASFSSMVDEAFEEFQRNISSEEAQMHLIKILLLSNELAKEIRKLSNVVIHNNIKISNEYSAWQSAMEKLTTEKMANCINYILANNGSNIESNMMDSVIMNFYDGIYNNNEFIPIRQERIKEALKLS